MASLAIIILTYNEEIHIERCINSIKTIADEIFVIDSCSNDRTASIAEKEGAVVIKNAWPGNHALQFNWALAHAPLKSEWVLRLDADEYLSEGLKTEIEEKLNSLSEETTGIVLPFERMFLGRKIARGTGGIKMLRLFRFGKAVCEHKWMDEHIQLLEGESIEFEHAFIDDNLNNLSWWTNKHIGYAIREAVDLLDIELGLTTKPDNLTQLSEQARSKRRKKIKYAKQPLFLRSFAYFIYRYFIKLGFLEGKEGFLWHFLQGWWYRTLVDAKVWEIKRACGNNPQRIKDHLKDEYNITI